MNCFTKTHKLFPSPCHPSSSSNCRFNNSTTALLPTRNLQTWFKEPKGKSSDKRHTSPASEVPFLHQPTWIVSALSRNCDVWVCNLRSKSIKKHSHLARVVVPELIMKPVRVSLFAFNLGNDIKHLGVWAAGAGALLVRLAFRLTGTL